MFWNKIKNFLYSKNYFKLSFISLYCFIFAFLLLALAVFLESDALTPIIKFFFCLSFFLYFIHKKILKNLRRFDITKDITKNLLKKK